MITQKKVRLTPGERNNLVKVLLDRLYPLLEKRTAEQHNEWIIKFDTYATPAEKAALDSIAGLVRAKEEYDELYDSVNHELQTLFPEMFNQRYGNRMYNFNGLIDRGLPDAIRLAVLRRNAAEPTLRPSQSIQDDMSATMLVLEQECDSTRELINKTLERFGFNYTHVADLFPGQS